MSVSLWPHGLQLIWLSCPSLSPRVCSDLCPLSQWCYPTISSCITPFSSCPQSFLAWGSFPVSQHFASDSQCIGTSASASVLPMNIQDWFPLGLTALIYLMAKKKKSLQWSIFFMVQLSCLYMMPAIILMIWTFIGSDVSAF